VKQLCQSLSTGNASVVDTPAPMPGRGQILVRVHASLISAGTERSVVEFAEKNLVQKAMARPDLARQLIQKAKREGWISTIEAARNRLDTDMTLGYSNAGAVIAVGEGVTEFKVGDHVACAGEFATHSEIVRIPRNLAAVIPTGPGTRNVSFEEAAFGTVAAIALQGVRLAELQLGETVAVIGLGLIGQIVAQLARANGCIVCGMDLSKERCALAERLGCNATASSEEEMKAVVARLSNGRGADAVLIAAATQSSSPVALAADIARDRGKVVSVGVVGLSLPRKPYFMKELSFRVSRSSGPGRYDPQYEEHGHDYPTGYVRWTEGRNLSAVLQLLAAGQLNCDALITHRFAIENADKGYELITGKTREKFLGVVITYANEPSLGRRVELPRIGARAAARSSNLRVGMIGAGNFATITLLPAIKAAGSIDLVGICASGGASARSAGSRFGFRYCASDVAELLNDEAIDTIAICTRHSSHARQVVAAINAEKHVFCEKPLAMNEKELASIVNACRARQSGRLLLVGYNRRFAPMATQMRQFLSPTAEPLIMHYRVNAGFIAADHWIQDREQGGGRILGEMCHFVDFLSYLCGQPVISVSAVPMANVGRYSDDNVAATLRFGGGSVGTITYTANGDKSYSKERIEAYSQGRIAILDDFRTLETVYEGKRKVTRSRLRVEKGHREEWQAFSTAVREGKESPISLGELVNSTLATLALVRACANGAIETVDTDRLVAATPLPNGDSAIEKEI
jgi:predicted dehydrogenase